MIAVLAILPVLPSGLPDRLLLNVLFFDYAEAVALAAALPISGALVSFGILRFSSSALARTSVKSKPASSIWGCNAEMSK
jgi:hypothetical protein